MPLDPQFAGLLKVLDETGVTPLTRGSAVEAREHYRELAMSRRGADYEPEQVKSVRDLHIVGQDGPLPIRMYEPNDDRGRALTFLHGGGWVFGDLDSHDPTCRRLANELGAVVVAVDYRLAPECPFPGPVHDALAGLRWTAERFTDRLLCVAGDSAGANMAGAVAVRARDEGIPLAGQLLIYPATSISATFPSVDENADGYFLTKADMEWFYEQYAPVAGDPLVDLLHADVAGVAPAVVATAEFDPLRDEGAAYAQRLTESGVRTVHVPGPGLIHGYFAFLSIMDAARERGAEVLTEFNALLEAR